MGTSGHLAAVSFSCTLAVALDTCHASPPHPRLAPLYPDTLMVGMELRDKVAEYVKERIGEDQARLWGGSMKAAGGPAALVGHRGSLPGMRRCAVVSSQLLPYSAAAFSISLPLKLASSTAVVSPVMPGPSTPSPPSWPLYTPPSSLPLSVPASRQPGAVSECISAAHQQHEVPAQLLQEGAAHQDVFPLPGKGAREWVAVSGSE